MNEPTITVRHEESAVEVRAMCSPIAERVGLDVDSSITYGVGQHMEALAAVDRLAESLRRQIADAAEHTPGGETVGQDGKVNGMFGPVDSRGVPQWFVPVED